MSLGRLLLWFITIFTECVSGRKTSKNKKNVIETLNNVQTQLDTLVKETHKAIIDTRVAFEKADNDNIKFWKG